MFSSMFKVQCFVLCCRKKKNIGVEPMFFNDLLAHRLCPPEAVSAKAD